MDTAQQQRLERKLDDALQRGQLDAAICLAEQYVAQAEYDKNTQSLARLPWFRARFVAARVLLASGQLRRSLTYLTEISTYLDEVDISLASQVRLLHAECLVRLNRHSEGRQLLAEVNRRAITRDPLLRLKRLQVQLWLGNILAEIDELRACHRVLEQASDTTNNCLLWCEEGRAWETCGEVKKSQNAWTKAESIFQQQQQQVQRSIGVDLCLLIGRFKHLQGELQQALDYFEKGREWASGEFAQRALLNLRCARVLIDLNQREKAREIYRHAVAAGANLESSEELTGLRVLLSLLTNDIDAEKHIEQLTQERQIQNRDLAARIAIRRGELKEAMELYSTAWQDSESPTRRARIALALGMLSMACGQHIDAQLWIARAIELARDFSLPEIEWRAYEVRGRLAAERGDEDAASRDFETSVAIVEKQSRKLELPMPYRLHRTDVLRELLSGACRRGDVAGAFRYQELRRGRLLLELWEGRTNSGRRLGGQGGAKLDEINAKLHTLEHSKKGKSAAESEPTIVEIDALTKERENVLDQLLCSRNRERGSALPVIPSIPELEKRLPNDTAFAVMCDLNDALNAVVLYRGQEPRIVSVANPGGVLQAQIARLRETVHRLLGRYRNGIQLDRADRCALDHSLDALGTGPLGTILRKILATETNQTAPQRLIVVPDGALTAVPFQAVRLEGRYLIERCSVVNQFSAALMNRRQTSSWLRSVALAVSEAPKKLPLAEGECVRVLRTFLLRRHLRGDRAKKNAVRKYLRYARVAHFACHAEFQPNKPQHACLQLPAGEMWYAAEWVDEPIDGLSLATLSACRSAETAELFPNESFGLVAGFLSGGARAVLAGLWLLADRETAPLMERFYRHRLVMDLADALAVTQREAIAADCSPLFWAPLTLFGDATALRGVRWPWFHTWFTDLSDRLLNKLKRSRKAMDGTKNDNRKKSTLVSVDVVDIWPRCDGVRCLV